MTLLWGGEYHFAAFGDSADLKSRISLPRNGKMQQNGILYLRRHVPSSSLDICIFVDLKGLDQETFQYFLEQRIKRLENVLDKVYPELMGMVECLLWLMNEWNKLHPRWQCEQHVTEGCLRRSFQIDSEEIRQCFKCRNMFHSILSQTTSTKRKGGFYNYRHGNMEIVKVAISASCRIPSLSSLN